MQNYNQLTVNLDEGRPLKFNGLLSDFTFSLTSLVLLPVYLTSVRKAIIFANIAFNIIFKFSLKQNV